jgi:hypothetical protein
MILNFVEEDLERKSIVKNITQWLFNLLHQFAIEKELIENLELLKYKIN